MRKFTRRQFLLGATALAGAALLPALLSGNKPRRFNITMSDEDWKKRLTPEQYKVLRREGTERAFTSPLNDEKRSGVFHCAGCDQALFTSDMKYDSGTGWPSFFDVIDGAVGTKEDRKLFSVRTEYHCSNCGGHHGHVFEDGPQPTGLRYCNNGVTLIFKPNVSRETY